MEVSENKSTFQRRADMDRETSIIMLVVILGILAIAGYFWIT